MRETEYLIKWAKYLNLEMVCWHFYIYNGLSINFRSRNFTMTNYLEDWIEIIEISSNRIIQHYSSGFISEIEDNSMPPYFKYSDKLVVKVLIKIISNSPKYFKRIQELNEIESCLNSVIIKFPNVFETKFDINKFEVYKLHLLTENRKWIVGKDDRFEIIELKKWYVKYNFGIVENEYLNSLIPPSTKEERIEYVYAPTAIGEEVRSFEIDEKYTEKLREEIDISKLIAFQN